MADKEINNQRDFFKEVRLDETGALVIGNVSQTGDAIPVGNAYQFFKKLALDEDGKIKTARYINATPPYVNDYAFDFDGVDERFTIPNVQIGSYLAGVTPNGYSVSFKFKRKDITTSLVLLSQWGGTKSFIMEFPASIPGKFLMYNRIGSNTGSARSTPEFLSTSDFYYLTYSFDPTQSMGSRASLMVDGVQIALDNDDINETANVSGGGFLMGERSGLNANAIIKQMVVTNRSISLTEHTSIYNGANPETEFGSDCVFHFNPDNATFDGTNWSVANQGVTATSINMELGDKI